jgi:hypothetical protein
MLQPQPMIPKSEIPTQYSKYLFHALETSLSWIWMTFRIDSAHLSLKSNEQRQKLLKRKERNVGGSGELRFIT